jgi:hypothetical protein
MTMAPGGALLGAIGDGGRYPGGKGLAGIYQWILSTLPTHAYYAEPFAGLGAIFRRKPPALRSYLIDADSRVVAWWRRRADPGAIVHCGDGIRWVELAAEWAGPELLIYADPPYLLSTRSKTRIYQHEMTVNDHVRLLCAAVCCRCYVVISGYSSALYDRYLDDWHRVEHPAITRGGVMRTEVLWCNYDRRELLTSPALTMEYSALGETFRERERVSRKIRRWQAKLAHMTARERLAVTMAVLSAGCDR